MNWRHFGTWMIQGVIFALVLIVLLMIVAAIVRVIWSDFQKKDKD